LPPDFTAASNNIWHPFALSGYLALQFARKRSQASEERMLPPLAVEPDKMTTESATNIYFKIASYRLEISISSPAARITSTLILPHCEVGAAGLKLKGSAIAF
jgi:hypothetical protein